MAPFPLVCLPEGPRAGFGLCGLYTRYLPQARRNKKQALLEVHCLLHLGHVQEARMILDQELQNSDYDPDLYLAYANTYAANGSPTSPEDDATRLEWINRIYNKIGLTPIAKLDSLRPLAIDNLVALNQASNEDQALTKELRFQ